MVKDWIWGGRMEEDSLGNISKVWLRGQSSDPDNDSLILHEDLSPEFGMKLASTINWFYDELVKSNAASGNFVIGNMKKFHGVTLRVTLELPDKNAK